MDNIKNTLKKIGLTTTEIEIYLNGLNFHSVDVAKLEKTTNIKRTTIYHALNTLSQKGLVAKKEHAGKMTFAMTDPIKLLKMLKKDIGILKNQEKELEKIIPLLKTKKNKNNENFQVFHFEGAEGIKNVVDEALYCKNRHWDIIAPVKNFFSDFDKEYAKYFIEKRKLRGITARSLWEKDFSRRALSKEEVTQRQPRYLPIEMQGKFKSVIIIFDDKVAFISSVEELSAILINSKEIKETMQAMFDGLWISSKDYSYNK